MPALEKRKNSIKSMPYVKGVKSLVKKPDIALT
jgi:hypothetical protein